MTVVRGMEGPMTLEGHSQSCDPGEASTANSGHFPSMYPRVRGHLCDPPSLSRLPCPNRVGSGQTLEGPAKHQEAGVGGGGGEVKDGPTTLSPNHVVQDHPPPDTWGLCAQPAYCVREFPKGSQLLQPWHKL